jgi:hypothetical protein
MYGFFAARAFASVSLRLPLGFGLFGGKPASLEKHRTGMPIVALAFHEHLALEKLNRYFESAEAASGESRPTTCSKCSLEFAIVFVNRADKKNADYLKELRTLIENDCINGLHRDEYALSSRPVAEN